MFTHYRTKGIVFKKENRGEADQLFSIYTQDFGRLEILGKGIRKITSKLRSQIDIFYFSEIEFIQGKTYKTLTDALVINKFKNLKRNLKRSFLAYKIGEIIDFLMIREEKDEKNWLLIKEVFEKLNDSSLKEVSFSLLFYYFFWRIISFLGYQPQISNCLFCQKKVSFFKSSFYFVFKEGSVVCQKCFKEKKLSQYKHLKIELAIIKILKLILKENWQILEKLKINEKQDKILNSLSTPYFHYWLKIKK